MLVLKTPSTELLTTSAPTRLFPRFDARSNCKDFRTVPPVIRSARYALAQHAGLRRLRPLAWPKHGNNWHTWYQKRSVPETMVEPPSQRLWTLNSW